MTAQFELVWAPLILSVLFLLAGLLVIGWRRRKLKGLDYSPRGQKGIIILGFSLLILSGFSLFISLFFMITG